MRNSPFDTGRESIGFRAGIFTSLCIFVLMFSFGTVAFAQHQNTDAAESGTNTYSNFGTPVTWNVVFATDPNLANYSISSTPTSGASDLLGSTISILDGVVASDTTVSIAWRNRSDYETSPTHQSPPMYADFDQGLTADIADISGLDGTTFVLQSTYDESEVYGIEADEAAGRCLFLTWMSPMGTPGDDSDDIWLNAVQGNSNYAGAGVSPFEIEVGNPILSSYADYYAGTLSSDGSTKSANSFKLGDWGVDIDGNGDGGLDGNIGDGGVVWAVIDHNSQFAAMPEPSSAILFLIGLVSLIGCGNRRSRG
jgi:hypothetical protein